MRFINVYLIVYFVIIAAAIITLAIGGALGSIPPLWIAISLVIAIGLGIVLAISARPMTEE